MENTIVWALLTGFVTGGTWVGIVLFRVMRRQRELTGEQDRFRTDLHRLDELDQVHARLAEVEERLEFAERLLTRPQGAQLPPSDG